MVNLIQMIHRFEVRLKKSSKGRKKHKISMETVGSREDLPEGNAVQDQVIKEEDDEMSFYRIIKKICQEIVISKPE